MADEAKAVVPPSSKKKQEEAPAGAPAWMATFSDMTTLLLTFFIMLMVFAKFDIDKTEPAMGSLRDAFGGYSLQPGETVQMGKSPDNSPRMFESDAMVRPFPIEFLTTEGFLDKHEINRASDEEILEMRNDLADFEMEDMVNIYEEPEGIKVRVKDRIYFREKSTEISQLAIGALEKISGLLANKNWVVFVEGHAGRGETGMQGEDAQTLSFKRTLAITSALIKRGVSPKQITSVAYGDTRPELVTGAVNQSEDGNRRVEFLIRKRDLRFEGHKVESQ